MSVVPLTVSSDYGWVLAAATTTFFVHGYHIYLTAGARAKAKVPYPIAYADSEAAEKDPKVMAFNCAQRAHANFTENHTSLLGALLIAGLKYPIVSAGLGFSWAVSRTLYAKGYVAQGPKGRRAGSTGHYLTFLGLLFTAGYVAVSTALEL